MVPETPISTDQDPLVEYLAFELGTALERQGVEMHPDLIIEQAIGLRLFMEHQKLAPPLPSGLLAIICARSLSAIGHRKVGEGILLEACREEAALDIDLLRPFVTARFFDLRVWRLIQAGVLSRYRGGLRAEGRTAWVLDLSRVPRGHEVLDLTIYLSLRKLIEMFLPVWAAGEGDFALHLRGLPAKPAKSEQHLPSPQDLMQYVRDLLEKHAETLEWGRIPDLHAMDLSIHLA